MATSDCENVTYEYLSHSDPASSVDFCAELSLTESSVLCVVDSSHDPSQSISCHTLKHVLLKHVPGARCCIGSSSGSVTNSECATVARVRNEKRATSASSPGCGYPTTVSQTAQDLINECLAQVEPSARRPAPSNPKRKIKVNNNSKSSLVDKDQDYCIRRNTIDPSCVCSDKSYTKCKVIESDSPSLLNNSESSPSSRKSSPPTQSVADNVKSSVIILKPESLGYTPESAALLTSKPSNGRSKPCPRHCHPHTWQKPNKPLGSVKKTHSGSDPQKPSPTHSLGEALTSKLLQLLDSGIRQEKDSKCDCKCSDTGTSDESGSKKHTEEVSTKPISSGYEIKKVPFTCPLHKEGAYARAFRDNRDMKTQPQNVALQSKVNEPLSKDPYSGTKKIEIEENGSKSSCCCKNNTPESRGEALVAKSCCLRPETWKGGTPTSPGSYKAKPAENKIASPRSRPVTPNSTNNLCSGPQQSPAPTSQREAKCSTCCSNKTPKPHTSRTPNSKSSVADDVRISDMQIPAVKSGHDAHPTEIQGSGPEKRANQLLKSQVTCSKCCKNLTPQPLNSATHSDAEKRNDKIPPRIRSRNETPIPKDTVDSVHQKVPNQYPQPQATCCYKNKTHESQNSDRESKSKKTPGSKRPEAEKRPSQSPHHHGSVHEKHAIQSPQSQIKCSKCCKYLTCEPQNSNINSDTKKRKDKTHPQPKDPDPVNCCNHPDCPQVICSECCKSKTPQSQSSRRQSRSGSPRSKSPDAKKRKDKTPPQPNGPDPENCCNHPDCPRVICSECCKSTTPESQSSRRQSRSGSPRSKGPDTKKRKDKTPPQPNGPDPENCCNHPDCPRVICSECCKSTTPESESSRRQSRSGSPRSKRPNANKCKDKTPPRTRSRNEAAIHKGIPEKRTNESHHPQASCCCKCKTPEPQNSVRQSRSNSPGSKSPDAHKRPNQTPQSHGPVPDNCCNHPDHPRIICSEFCKSKKPESQNPCRQSRSKSPRSESPEGEKRKDKTRPHTESRNKAPILKESLGSDHDKRSPQPQNVCTKCCKNKSREPNSSRQSRSKSPRTKSPKAEKRKDAPDPKECECSVHDKLQVTCSECCKNKTTESQNSNRQSKLKSPKDEKRKDKTPPRTESRNKASIPIECVCSAHAKPQITCSKCCKNMTTESQNSSRHSRSEFPRSKSPTPRTESRTKTPIPNKCACSVHENPQVTCSECCKIKTPERQSSSRHSRSKSPSLKDPEAIKSKDVTPDRRSSRTQSKNSFRECLRKLICRKNSGRSPEKSSNQSSETHIACLESCKNKTSESQNSSKQSIIKSPRSKTAKAEKRKDSLVSFHEQRSSQSLQSQVKCSDYCQNKTPEPQYLPSQFKVKASIPKSVCPGPEKSKGETATCREGCKNKKLERTSSRGSKSTPNGSPRGAPQLPNSILHLGSEPPIYTEPRHRDFSWSWERPESLCKVESPTCPGGRNGKAPEPQNSASYTRAGPTTTQRSSSPRPKSSKEPSQQLTSPGGSKAKGCCPGVEICKKQFSSQQVRPPPCPPCPDSTKTSEPKGSYPSSSATGSATSGGKLERLPALSSRKTATSRTDACTGEYKAQIKKSQSKISLKFKGKTASTTTLSSKRPLGKITCGRSTSSSTVKAEIRIRSIATGPDMHGEKSSFSSLVRAYADYIRKHGSMGTKRSVGTGPNHSGPIDIKKSKCRGFCSSGTGVGDSIRSSGAGPEIIRSDRLGSGPAKYKISSIKLHLGDAEVSKDKPKLNVSRSSDAISPYLCPCGSHASPRGQQHIGTRASKSSGWLPNGTRSSLAYSNGPQKSFGAGCDCKPNTSKTCYLIFEKSRSGTLRQCCTHTVLEKTKEQGCTCTGSKHINASQGGTILPKSKSDILKTRSVGMHRSSMRSSCSCSKLEKSKKSTCTGPEQYLQGESNVVTVNRVKSEVSGFSFHIKPGEKCVDACPGGQKQALHQKRSTMRCSEVEIKTKSTENFLAKCWPFKLFKKSKKKTATDACKRKECGTSSNNPSKTQFCQARRNYHQSQSTHTESCCNSNESQANIDDKYKRICETLESLSHPLVTKSTSMDSCGNPYCPFQDSKHENRSTFMENCATSRTFLDPTMNKYHTTPIKSCKSPNCPYQNSHSNKNQAIPRASYPYCPFKDSKISEKQTPSFKSCQNSHSPFNVQNRQTISMTMLTCPDPSCPFKNAQTKPEKACAHPCCPFQKSQHQTLTGRTCPNSSCPFRNSEMNNNQSAFIKKCDHPCCPFQKSKLSKNEAMPQQTCPNPNCPFKNSEMNSNQATPMKICEHPCCPFQNSKLSNNETLSTQSPVGSCPNPNCPFKNSEMSSNRATSMKICEHPCCPFQYSQLSKNEGKPTHSSVSSCPNPNCPFNNSEMNSNQATSMKICEHPCCPFQNSQLSKSEAKFTHSSMGSCPNRNCPFKKSEMKSINSTPLKVCDHPCCPSQNSTLNKNEDMPTQNCPNPSCPFKKSDMNSHHSTPITICENPCCPFQNSESSKNEVIPTHSCPNPNCPFQTSEFHTNQSTPMKICENPCCPFQNSELSKNEALPAQSCPNPICPFKKSEIKNDHTVMRTCDTECLFQDSQTKKNKTMLMQSCPNPSCPFKHSEVNSNQATTMTSCENPCCPFLNSEMSSNKSTLMKSCENPCCPFKNSEINNQSPFNKSCENSCCRAKNSDINSYQTTSMKSCENPCCPFQDSQISQYDTMSTQSCPNPRCPFKNTTMTDSIQTSSIIPGYPYGDSRAYSQEVNSYNSSIIKCPPTGDDKCTSPCRRLDVILTTRSQNMAGRTIPKQQTKDCCKRPSCRFEDTPSITHQDSDFSDPCFPKDSSADTHICCCGSNSQCKQQVSKSDKSCCCFKSSKTRKNQKAQKCPNPGCTFHPQGTEDESSSGEDTDDEKQYCVNSFSISLKKSTRNAATQYKFSDVPKQSRKQLPVQRSLSQPNQQYCRCPTNQVPSSSFGPRVFQQYRTSGLSLKMRSTSYCMYCGQRSRIQESRSQVDNSLSTGAPPAPQPVAELDNMHRLKEQRSMPSYAEGPTMNIAEFKKACELLEHMKSRPSESADAPSQEKIEYVKSVQAQIRSTGVQFSVIPSASTSDVNDSSSDIQEPTEQKQDSDSNATEQNEIPSEQIATPYTRPTEAEKPPKQTKSDKPSKRNTKSCQTIPVEIPCGKICLKKLKSAMSASGGGSGVKVSVKPSKTKSTQTASKSSLKINGSTSAISESSSGSIATKTEKRVKYAKKPKSVKYPPKRGKAPDLPSGKVLSEKLTSSSSAYSSAPSGSSSGTQQDATVELPCGNVCSQTRPCEKVTKAAQQISAESSTVAKPAKAGKGAEGGKSPCVCPPDTPCVGQQSKVGKKGRFGSGKGGKVAAAEGEAEPPCVCPPDKTPCVGLAIRTQSAKDRKEAPVPTRPKTPVKLMKPKSYKGNTDGVISREQYEINKKKKKKTKLLVTDVCIPVCDNVCSEKDKSEKKERFRFIDCVAGTNMTIKGVTCLCPPPPPPPAPPLPKPLEALKVFGMRLPCTVTTMCRFCKATPKGPDAPVTVSESKSAKCAAQCPCGNTTDPVSDPEAKVRRAAKSARKKTAPCDDTVGLKVQIRKKK